MAIPKKGTRRIVVDGARYRWYVRRRPTLGQAIAESNLTLAVEKEGERRGSVLVVDLAQPHPSNVVGEPPVAVLPADVARCIQAALRLGWRPDAPGKPFLMNEADGEQTGIETG